MFNSKSIVAMILVTTFVGSTLSVSINPAEAQRKPTLNQIIKGVFRQIFR